MTAANALITGFGMGLGLGLVALVGTIAIFLAWGMFISQDLQDLDR